MNTILLRLVGIWYFSSKGFAAPPLSPPLPENTFVMKEKQIYSIYVFSSRTGITT